MSARRLREPHIPELEAAFAQFLHAEDQRLRERESYVDEVHQQDAGALSAAERADLAGTAGVVSQMRSELTAWLEQLDTDESAADLASRGRGASPPTDKELRAFALTYLSQRLTSEWGAKTRTADEVAMNRTTVYRWIRLCQERGLLPLDEGDAP